MRMTYLRIAVVSLACVAGQSAQAQLFGDDQARQAILDLRLQRLTGLEREKIDRDYFETMQLIEYLQSVLAEVQIGAAQGFARHATAVLLTPLHTFWHQHSVYLIPQAAISQP